MDSLRSVSIQIFNQRQRKAAPTRTNWCRDRVPPLSVFRDLLGPPAPSRSRYHVQRHCCCASVCLHRQRSIVIYDPEVTVAWPSNSGRPGAMTTTPTDGRRTINHRCSSQIGKPSRSKTRTRLGALTAGRSRTGWSSAERGGSEERRDEEKEKERERGGI